MNDNMKDTFLDNDNLELDLVELATALLKNTGVIIFVTLLCGLLSFAFSAFMIQPVYSADALMIVNSGSSATTYITSDQLRSSASLVETYSIIIKSDTVKQLVQKNLGMEETYDQTVRLVTVDAVNATQIMKISVRATDPAVALAVCEEITKVCPDMIVSMAEAGSANIVTAAQTTGNPISPNVEINTILGAMLGLFCTCGVIILRSILNNKVSKEIDIRLIGMTTLGVIPSYEEGGK